MTETDESTEVGFFFFVCTFKSKVFKDFLNVAVFLLEMLDHSFLGIMHT